ncbi:TatD family hydrolase [Candidatus Saccharibacteria bacterium]|nr:TatD family hydrolase [Candidatus Saccharibacteria bacterium]
MKFDYFIDSHCHMHDEEFYAPHVRDELVKKAVNSNVKKMILIGTSYEDSFDARDYALSRDEKRDTLFWSYGVHPDGIEKERKAPDFKLAMPIAIGEVGLDYHYLDEFDDPEYVKSEQKKLFKEMIAIAEEYDLPMIFHVREAFNDFFEIIDQHPTVRGVVHSFTDSKKNLKKCLERGFYIGVNGLATYSTLPTPPLDKILLETDAPFLAPVPHRGEQNESSYIPEIAMWLAEKLNVSVEEVMQKTSENCHDLFNF